MNYSWNEAWGREDGSPAKLYEGPSQYDAMKAAERNAAETGELASVTQTFNGRKRTWYILPDGTHARSFEDALNRLLHPALERWTVFK